MLKKLITRLFSRAPQRHVIVHCPSGNITLPVQPGDIIHVPWMVSWSYCPFHLESSGKVSLRLEEARGYGKIYSGITWEETKGEK